MKNRRHEEVSEGAKEASQAETEGKSGLRPERRALQQIAFHPTIEEVRRMCAMCTLLLCSCKSIFLCFRRRAGQAVQESFQGFGGCSGIVSPRAFR